MVRGASKLLLSCCCHAQVLVGCQTTADPFHDPGLVLLQILRERWGFEGFVASDCGAVDSVSVLHHFAKYALCNQGGGTLARCGSSEPTAAVILSALSRQCCTWGAKTTVQAHAQETCCSPLNALPLQVRVMQCS